MAKYFPDESTEFLTCGEKYAKIIRAIFVFREDIRRMFMKKLVDFLSGLLRVSRKTAKTFLLLFFFGWGIVLLPVTYVFVAGAVGSGLAIVATPVRYYVIFRLLMKL